MNRTRARYRVTAAIVAIVVLGSGFLGMATPQVFGTNPFAAHRDGGVQQGSVMLSRHPRHTAAPRATATGVKGAAPSTTVAPTKAPTASPSPSRMVSSPSTAPTSAPSVGITPSPVPSAPAAGSGYYVATTGSDSASGTAASPWLTLQHAANVAPAGSVIYVRGGTYGPFTLTRSGLTFQGYPGETAVVQGTSSSYDTVHIEGVTSATLTYLTVTGNQVQYGSGIRVEASSGVELAHLVVHDNTSFGIRTNNSSAVIEQSDIYYNHSGVEIARAGTVTIRNNDIHDNNKMVDSGVGAQGVSFYYTTGKVVASSNRIWSNHTLAGDPEGPDGAGFEIYAASNVTMTYNVLYDNRDALESGTDSSRTACSNNTFVGNAVSKTNSNQTDGLIIRCFDHGLIANNTFVGLDKFAFDVSSYYESYGGSIEALRILNNLVVNGRAYSVDDAIPSSVVMDYNLAYTTSASTAEYGTYDAWVYGHDQTTSLATFQGWTGTAAHDIWGRDPLLDSSYCPRAGSPAINAGTPIGYSYSGSAPDIGYCEVG